MIVHKFIMLRIIIVHAYICVSSIIIQSKLNISNTKYFANEEIDFVCLFMYRSSHKSHVDYISHML